MPYRHKPQYGGGAEEVLRLSDRRVALKRAARADERACVCLCLRLVVVQCDGRGRGDGLRHWRGQWHAGLSARQPAPLGRIEPVSQAPWRGRLVVRGGGATPSRADTAHLCRHRRLRGTSAVGKTLTLQCTGSGAPFFTRIKDTHCKASHCITRNMHYP